MIHLRMWWNPVRTKGKTVRFLNAFRFEKAYLGNVEPSLSHVAWVKLTLCSCCLGHNWLDLDQCLSQGLPFVVYLWGSPTARGPSNCWISNPLIPILFHRRWRPGIPGVHSAPQEACVLKSLILLESLWDRCENHHFQGQKTKAQIGQLTWGQGADKR